MDIKYFLSPFMLHQLRYAKHFIHYIKHQNKVAENKKYRNIHRGERCFIIGSGPSMAKTDISALAGEHVIALNSFFMNPQCNEVLNDRRKEKYYLVPPNHPPQTEEDWKQTLRSMEVKIQTPLPMFWGIDFNEGNWREIIEKNNFFPGFSLNYFYCGVNTRDGYELQKKDLDISRMSVSASNALINGLELALFMGFSQIYLLGFEHNHICVQRPEEYRAYFNAGHYEKELDYDFGSRRPNHVNFEILGNNYFTFKIYLEILKLFPETQIVNCTPGGILDVFPRKKFEEVIAMPVHPLNS